MGDPQVRGGGSPGEGVAPPGAAGSPAGGVAGGGLRLDAPGASDAATRLAAVMGEEVATLRATPPTVPAGAFGRGVAAEAARVVSLLAEAHRVRVAHAARLGDAAADAGVLVRAVAAAEEASASSFPTGDRPVARGGEVRDVR
ncbi:hypothetical protein MTQ22_01055 [Corynebacterium bovis]|uniref:hypothetical protein n=1 Tax=Corynebacterium bovis TaxID=36808 RepID=UPI003139C18C